MIYHGTCHCGAVTFAVDDTPRRLVRCNCSVCRRIGALWCHTSLGKVTFTATQDATIAYVWGDRMLAFHSCKTCGCTTHYMPLDKSDGMAVNMTMADPETIKGLRVRHFDGANSWAFID